MLGPAEADAQVGGIDPAELVELAEAYARDTGYPVHWTRSPLPSNALACMYGLVADCRQRDVLGPDVDLKITGEPPEV